MAATKLIRTKVFISYSHKDEAILQRLQVHLKPLERDGHIERWDDTKIAVGRRWRQEISQAMDAARIAVLLVSPDFMASDFIAKDELPPLLLAAEREGLVIMCVNLSHYYEHGETLGQFQQANPPSKPLEGMSKVEQDAVLAKLAKEIVAILHPKVDQTGISASAQTDQPTDHPVSSGLWFSDLAQTLAPGAGLNKLFDLKLGGASEEKESNDWHKLLELQSSVKDQSLASCNDEFDAVSVAVQVAIDNSQQAISNKQKTAAHLMPLNGYPIGPMIKDLRVGKLAAAFAEVHYGRSVLPLFAEINDKLKKAANPGDPELRIAAVMFPTALGSQYFWEDVLHHSAIQGPRMLAAVLSIMELPHLDENAKIEWLSLVERINTYHE